MSAKNKEITIISFQVLMGILIFNNQKWWTHRLLLIKYATCKALHKSLIRVHLSVSLHSKKKIKKLLQEI